MFSGLEVATKVLMMMTVVIMITVVIKNISEGLMTDPTWNWVFKNTFDAMEEQLNKVCMTHDT